MNDIASDDVVRTLLRTEGDPYSPEARVTINGCFTEYAEQLVLEATHLAKRDSLQQISPVHVEEAKKRLRSIERRNWKKKLCGQSSGVLLGVGLSTLVPILSNISQASTLILTIGVVSSIIGTAFLMYDALT